MRWKTRLNLSLKVFDVTKWDEYHYMVFI